MEFGQSLDLYSLTKGSKKNTNPSKIKLSTSKVKLAVGKTKKIKAKVVVPKGKKTKWQVKKLRYLSSNTNIAKVNSSGKITAKAKGTCYVYLITQNGLNVKMKITVK